MNLQTIRDTVAKQVPEAKDIRTREIGNGVFALLCEWGGRMRSVMFTQWGLYGEDVPSLMVLPKSDLVLAAQLAKALEK